MASRINKKRKMYDTPISLQGCCVDFICDNLEELCDVNPIDSPLPKMTFKDPDVYFHGDLSEQLLTKLCDKGKLTDDTLCLFNPNTTCLKRVSIHDSQLTTKGLRTLRAHRITDLEIKGLRTVTVNDVIGCLGEWTLSNLKSLNVTHSTFMNSTNFIVVISLTKLQNLQSLNVSHTEFNNHGLEIITTDLPCLEHLDISNTRVTDISAVRKCKDRLKSLSIYNIRPVNEDEVIPILFEMKQLVHLDISEDPSVQPLLNLQNGRFKIKALFSDPECLPCLTSIDISGKEGANEEMIREFMVTHTLRFLGASLTPYCEYEMFADEKKTDIVVTGEANEKQILEALRRYVLRAVYVQKSLYTLFRLTQVMLEPREDIIRLVLPAMNGHPKQLGVQMAATACLYNLSKGEVGQKVHPACLKHVVNSTLSAMENFPHHQQLQKNALLTLCSDRILQDVSFDRYRCARLVMECLCQFDETSMNRMSVAICSILAAKISTEQTSMLGAKARYMKKMLELVKQKVENKVIDITLKFTLSALWNLTDESPPTCCVFLKEGGLDLFMETLQIVSEMETDTRTQVETKILGLLNNIAEVKNLREALMRDDFMMLGRRLMHAETIDVGYFAAGIIAHLASDGPQAWLVGTPEREELLSELGDVVLKWEQPKGEMVAYRSFKPFFPLLTCKKSPTVQLWAVWAIQHVCTKNGERYCPMLEDEGGADLLRRMIVDPESNKHVVEISKDILKLGRENKAQSKKKKESQR